MILKKRLSKIDVIIIVWAIAMVTIWSLNMLDFYFDKKHADCLENLCKKECEGYGIYSRFIYGNSFDCSCIIDDVSTNITVDYSECDKIRKDIFDMDLYDRSVW